MTESLHALSGAYVADALDDAERESFEQHLPGCLDCQAEVASLREATAAMADLVALSPPPALRESVLAGIKTIRPLPPETTTSADVTDDDEAAEPGTATDPAPLAAVLPLRSRRRRIAALVAAAAAVVAVGVGTVTQPWQDDEPPTAQLSPTDQVLTAADAKRYSIRFDDGATATVVRSLSEGRAVIVTRNMAAPPPGKAFQLWFQDDSGSMVPAGLMKDKGDQKILLEGDATTATGVGITVEPEGGSLEPTSDPIALFELDEADA